jgi:hypothetical protein
LRGLVAGVLLVDNLHIALGSCGFKQLDDALSIGRSIVHDRDAFDALMLDGIVQQALTMARSLAMTRKVSS